MKKAMILVLAAIVLYSCGGDTNHAETADKKEETTVSGINYSVDTTSTVSWKGTKPTGEHTGIFPVEDGTLIVNSDSLVGGSFVIDIAKIKNSDLAADADNQAKLEGHLKSPDFFDVAKYPLANFVITDVSRFVADSTKEVLMKDATHTITGNLTLKDVTKSVTFPAKVTVDDATAAAQADFNIDRTDWGLNYKGPNNPQDWVISKTVNIKLNVTATKK